MERYRTTIILVAVLVVLGGLAVALSGKKSPVVPGEPTPTPAQFIWQSNDQIVGIDVVSGTKKVSLTRDTNTASWSLTEPIKEAADSFAVSNQAGVLQNLQATTVLTGNVDLVKYNLDKPVMTVTSTFSDTAHTKRVLQVGGLTFDGSGYYTKVADQPTVYIVSNSIIEPVRSWFETPPRFVPTPAPLLPTAPPTSAITGTQTVTGTSGITTSPALTVAPSSLTTATNVTGGTSTPASSLVTTTPIGVSSAITSTSPGAANATTPVSSPLIATATAQP